MRRFDLMANRVEERYRYQDLFWKCLKEKKVFHFPFIPEKLFQNNKKRKHFFSIC